jgi:hypothetical protein
MPMWLGNPGGVVQLPYPARGLTPTLSIPATVRRTIGGGQVVSRAGAGRRTYQLAWEFLTPEQFSVLEEFYTRARGPGPFALLDPGRRNRLSLNQSSATSTEGNAAGFTVDPSEAVTPNPDVYLRGPQSLRWTLPATVSAGVLDFDAPRGLFGVPAPAGQPWTFSGVLSLGTPGLSVSVTPVLSWRRIDGSEAAVTSGTPVAAAPGAWTAYSVQLAAPPAGAVSLRPQLRVAPGVLVTAGAGVDVTETQAVPTPRPGSIQVTGGLPGTFATVVAAPRRTTRDIATVERGPTNAADVLVDQPMLDMFLGVRAWVLGTGVPRVSFVALPETNRLLPFRDVTATLVEAG